MFEDFRDNTDKAGERTRSPSRLAANIAIIASSALFYPNGNQAPPKLNDKISLARPKKEGLLQSRYFQNTKQKKGGGKNECILGQAGTD